MRIDGNITDALVNLIGSYAYALLSYGPAMSVVSHNGIEAALGVLEQFKSLSCKPTSDYFFWEPLCAALKQVVQPFLDCFQTQVILHGIHAHLTVSEEDCPLCQQKVLDSTLGLFCAKIDLRRLDIGTLFFVAFIHRHASVDSDFLQREALEGRDVSIFDCFDAITSNNTLQLNFFAPLKFVQKGYRVTVTMVKRTSHLNSLITVVSARLRDMQTPWMNYEFCRTEWVSEPDMTQTNALFGTVTAHVSDGYQSETKISLSAATLEALSTAKLSTERVSSREVRLYCDSLDFRLSLSYPVNYNTLKIKLSKSNGYLTVSCQRQLYNLEEERPCFTLNPDNRLSLVPTTFNRQMILSQSSMQMTKEKSHLVTTLNDIQLQKQSSTHLKVKIFLQTFFEIAISCSSPLQIVSL